MRAVRTWQYHARRMERIAFVGEAAQIQGINARNYGRMSHALIVRIRRRRMLNSALRWVDNDASHSCSSHAATSAYYSITAVSSEQRRTFVYTCVPLSSLSTVSVIRGQRGERRKGKGRKGKGKRGERHTPLQLQRDRVQITDACASPLQPCPKSQNETQKKRAVSEDVRTSPPWETSF